MQASKGGGCEVQGLWARALEQEGRVRRGCRHQSRGVSVRPKGRWSLALERQHLSAARDTVMVDGAPKTSLHKKRSPAGKGRHAQRMQQRS